MIAPAPPERLRRSVWPTAVLSWCSHDAFCWRPRPPRVRSLQFAHDPETVGDIAYVDVVAKPRRRPHLGCLAVEIAAAQYPQAAIARCPCRDVLGSVAVIVVPAILDPFGGVA